MTAPAKVRQADAQRLFEAARRASLKPSRITLNPDGRIDIFLEGSACAHLTGNPWDDEAAK